MAVPEPALSWRPAQPLATATLVTSTFRHHLLRLRLCSHSKARLCRRSHPLPLDHQQHRGPEHNGFVRAARLPFLSVSDCTVTPSQSSWTPAAQYRPLPAVMATVLGMRATCRHVLPEFRLLIAAPLSQMTRACAGLSGARPMTWPSLQGVAFVPPGPLISSRSFGVGNHTLARLVVEAVTVPSLA